MRNSRWGLALSLCLLVGMLGSADAAPRRKLYIVAGPDGGHAPAGHAFYTSSVIWTNRLVQKHHNLDVVLLQGWPGNPSIFTNADAIMVYSDGGGDNEGNMASELVSRDHWATAMQVFNRGVSIGMTHYAVEPPGAYAMWPQQGWPFSQYGTGEFVKWMGGYYVGRYVTNLPTSDNSSFVPVTTFPDHPANPAPKITFPGFDDEWYSGLYFPKTISPLLTANNAPLRGGTQVLAWTYNREDGARSFGYTGGHWTYGSWTGGAAQTNALDLVLNAIEWLGRVNEEDHHQVVLPSCASWKYDVDGTMDSGWNQAGFSDASWSSGAAPLGYDDWGQDWIATQLAAGTTNNRPISTYFRKSFYVPTLLNVTNFLVKINADDGAVVYLNGTEIGRYNMPTGVINQGTAALSSNEVDWNLTFLSKPPYTQADWDAANGDQRWVWINQYNARNAAITNSSSPEFEWGRILNLSALTPGTNVLAVEVHQRNASNPDMRLDVEAVILGNNLYTPTNGPVDPYLGINNGAGVSNLQSSSATFCGNLTATNATQNFVWVYWGTTDGGTNKAVWQNSRSFGLRTPGPLSTDVTGLTGETRWYYRFYASNAVSQAWASPSIEFTTPMDLSAYAYKAKITFKGYNQASTLPDFPALIVFGTNITNFSYAQVQSPNGFDVRFANATQTELLSHEVEQWDPTGNSHVWVRVPALAASSDYIWAYWGNSSVAGQAPACQTNGSTWDTNFVAVWHLNEASGGNADSTANRLNCTWTGTQIRTNGIAGSSQYFNYNSFTRAAYNSKFNPTDKRVTVETWVQSTTSENHNQYQRIIDHEWSAGYCITLSGSAPTWVFRYDSAVGHDGSHGPIVDGNWHYGVFMYDGNIIDGFYDGISDVHTALTSPMNATAPVTIGADGGGGQKWHGRIDEVRISKTNRSTAWLWATRMTMASNAVFTGYGTAQSSAPSTAPSVNNASGASAVMTNTATLNGNLASTGGAPTSVWVYWGTSDAGTSKALWSNFASFGQRSPGALSTDLTGLTAGQAYSYRFYASNSYGEAWASAASFTTLSVSTSPVVIKVACIGDSITEGPAEGNYPATLQALLGSGYDVRNFGRAGACTIRSGDQPYANDTRFSDSTNFLPDLVVFMLGTNDGKPNNWALNANFTNDYTYFMDTYSNCASRPRILICIPCPALGDAWTINANNVNNAIIPAIRHYATTRGFPVVDVNARMTGHPEWFGDPIHPNTTGYTQIAAVVSMAITNPAASDGAATVLPESASWKYLDTGADLGTSWRAGGYNDGSWSSGAAPLGYPTNLVSTLVGYGADPLAKHITTYFRTTFQVTNLAAITGMHFSAKVDDGCVIFLNGKYVASTNLPWGVSNVNYQTLTPVYAPDAKPWAEFPISVSNLVQGVNTLAVEVHQNSPGSSDIFWQMKAEKVAYATQNPTTPEVAATNTPPASSTAGWTAYNDLFIQSGETSTNITAYNGLPSGTGGGTLLDFTSGTSLTARVDMSITGGGTLGQLGLDQTISAGSDVLGAFGGKLVPDGYFYWGNGVAMTLTLSNLNPASQYKVVLFGNRGAYTDRVMRVTLGDVAGFVNVSSAGAVKTTSALAEDTTQLPALNSAGAVFAYSQIQPGPDGDIVLSVQADGNYTAYLNAIMVQELASGGDTDGDGMDDAWESQYFGSGSAANGGMLEDWDHDGSSNYDEYRAGTDPTQAGSKFELTDMAATNALNQIVLRWTGVAGKTYSILQTTNIAGIWTPVRTGIPGVAPVTTYTGTVGTAQNFWRVRLE